MAQWTVTYAKCVCWKEFEIHLIKTGLGHWHIAASVFSAFIARCVYCMHSNSDTPIVVLFLLCDDSYVIICVSCFSQC